jgi:hypothetical protein
VDVRQLKEALWHRIKQLGKRQQQPPADMQAPADVQLRFQVRLLGLPANCFMSF